MYKYIIYKTDTGFILKLPYNSYKVTKYIEAIRLIELIGLELRPNDKALSVPSLEINLDKIVNGIDICQDIDKETTARLNIIDIEVA